MYEFVQGTPALALGSNGATRQFCNSLPYEALADEHWNECRTLVTAAHWCQLSDGAPCSREEIADLCNLNSEAGRPSDCASYISSPGVVPAPARRQVSTGNQNIRELQTWLNSIGCSVGSHGVDGVWGPDTAGAVQCAESQGLASVIASRFPFASTMRVTPTGKPFDPGSSSAQNDIAVAQEQRAGMSAIPWWGWTLIAVGGVSLLAFAGAILLADKKERR